MSHDTRNQTPAIADIKEILPHRPPFLFVDNIVAFTEGQSIVTEKYISAQEDFFEGHFPGRPIMPGVLISEALAQTCGLLIGLTLESKSRNDNSMLPEFGLTSIDIKFQQAVLPQSRLTMQASLQRQFGSLYRFSVEAAVGKATVAKGILSLGEIGDRQIGR
jgi:3-hydroxyacyl-[acyl-carrier-protein] dehydratase